jgi:solute carrier family 8 (sodium/calcium exchanger)
LQKGTTFAVKSGTLAFSVTVYTVMSLLAVGLLMLRRHSKGAGRAELGGPAPCKQLTGFLLVLLWLLYVLLSAMQSYGYISADDLF